MLTEDHKCHVNIPYNMEIHPNLHVAKLTRQRFTEQMNNVNKACLKRNRTRQRKGIFFNGIVSHLISTQESKQTSSNWSWLQLRSGRASQGRTRSIWWRPWFLHFRQSLTAKDFYPSIENSPYASLSIYFWICINMALKCFCIKHTKALWSVYKVLI